MNLEMVERVVALLNEYPVSEIAVQEGERRIVVKAFAGRPFALAQESEFSEAEEAVIQEELELADGFAEAPILSAGSPEDILLTAPLVGLFHHNMPPLAYGARVEAGQVVGSIESMKLMTDVVAEQSGLVVAVLIGESAPVEYGQPLLRLTAE